MNKFAVLVFIMTIGFVLVSLLFSIPDSVGISNKTYVIALFLSILGIYGIVQTIKLF